MLDMKEYGRICKKKYLTNVCGSDRNIRPSGTLPWAVTRQHMTDIINLVTCI
jgi:hypothetical protein